jgi:hypothetical protein
LVPTVSAAPAGPAATRAPAMGIINKQPGTQLATSRFMRVSHFLDHANASRIL